MSQTVTLTCLWTLTVHASLPRSRHKAGTRLAGRRGMPDLRGGRESEAGRDTGTVTVRVHLREAHGRVQVMHTGGGGGLG